MSGYRISDCIKNNHSGMLKEIWFEHMIVTVTIEQTNYIPNLSKLSALSTQHSALSQSPLGYVRI